MENKKTLSIQKIEIDTFKKIRNLHLEPENGANLFFGSFRSGKTSLCEFIQFILYGLQSVSLARDNAEDAKGRIYFTDGLKEYVVEREAIGGKEESSFFDLSENKAVDTDLTPGEYLTGMEEDSFDLITYFKQARYQTPLFRPKFSFLNQIASFHPENKNIYREEENWRTKKEVFRNAKRSGTLDQLISEEEFFKSELQDLPLWEAEKEKCKSNLQDINEKLDENDRRCVLLKADMATFSDDLQLSKNKANAEDIRKHIQAKEKECRLAAYNVTKKIGLLTEEELADMKDDYNRLSLAETALAEARTALSSAEENLIFHQNLFDGKDNKEHYEGEKKRIEQNKIKRVVIRCLGVVLMGVAASLFSVLHHLNYNFAICISAFGAVLLLGVALEFVSTLFSSNIKQILSENEKETISAFLDFYNRLCAHETTTQVYLEQVEQASVHCNKKNDEKEKIVARISKKISTLGYEETDGDLIAICDQIIEANDALYDLKQEIAEEETKYRALISTDVESKTLEVSPEFASLQKELSFLSVQNDSLYKKKALLSARLEEADKHLSRSKEELQDLLEEKAKQIQQQMKEYESYDLNHALALSRKERFEADLKETLTRSINEKISFILGEEESFLFDENFELCYRDRDSVLPLIASGGGVLSEMGLLAFRLSLAQLLGKTDLPMIFDDSFAMLEPDSARILYQKLCDTCSQFFIATSSVELCNMCSETAKIFKL